MPTHQESRLVRGLALLGLGGTQVDQACAEKPADVRTKAEAAFKPFDECNEGAGELRICED